MRKINLLKIILSVTIIALVSMLLPRFALGIGMITNPLILKDVLRGQEVSDKSTLFNPEDKTVIYQLSGRGEIAGWMSFYAIDDENLENPISEIEVLPKSYLDVKVKFTIPEDTPNGDYSGEIVVLSKPKSEEKKETDKTTITVYQMVSREVTIRVTDEEILEFDTTIIPLEYGVGRGEPLKIKVIYDNQGNVAIKPNLQLKIIQVSTGNVVHNAIYPYPEDELAVKPFERREFPNLIEWQTAGQPNGTYKAEFKIMLGNKVMSEDSFRFEVGRDISWYLALLANLGPNKLGIILIGIGIILLIVFFVRTFVFKKKDWMVFVNLLK